MIQDKIFINPTPNPSDGYIGIAWTEAHGDEYKAYIREDALLEFAKDNRDSAGKLSYTEFIEKIKSL